VNRDQWYQLLIKERTVQQEIDRLIRAIGPDAEGGMFLNDLLEGLVRCCADVASRIDQTRKDTPDV
jgi:hypothetical protein